MQKFVLFLLFEAAEFMCVNTDREKRANLRIILYKECNKCDVTRWVTCDETIPSRTVLALYIVVADFVLLNAAVLNC